jgi:dephospho-CoA kinase
MIRVGLTGGIGSGKTTVAKVFQTVGIPVYFSDTKGKYLMSHSAEIKTKLIKIFGQQAILSDNSSNRQFLANEVFTNQDKLKILNSIVHPVVMDDFEKWASEQQSPYVINESAILFESGIYKQLDKNIVVMADKQIRIERTIRRDKISKQQVLERIHNQTDDETRKKLADFFISNNNNDMIINQVLKIHYKLWENSRNG